MTISKYIRDLFNNIIHIIYVKPFIRYLKFSNIKLLILQNESKEIKNFQNV